MDNYATKNVLNGVMCSVQECNYNCEGTKCSAPSIKVAGAKANKSDDTECDTFKAKASM